MKILHLIDSGGLYGAEKMLLALCEEQIKQGLDVTILSCGEPNEPEKPLERAAKACNIKVKSWRMMPGLNRAGMGLIWSWIHQQNFTTLHSHGYKFNVLLALTKTRKNSLPICCTVHGYVNSPFPKKGWFYETIDKIAISRLNAIVRVNKLNDIPLLLRVLYGKKLHHIVNGIAPAGYTLEPKQGALNKLLIVGRLSIEKGHADLIQAMSQLVKHNIKTTLTVAGDGPLRKQLTDLTQRLGLQDHIQFLGFVNDMDTLYQTHDALLMPSYTEGLPITLLEAVSRKLPVFVTPVGGMPELVKAQECIIAIGDSESIVGKIMTWNELPEIPKAEIVCTLHNEFLRQYTSSQMTKKYSEIYQRISNSMAG